LNRSATSFPNARRIANIAFNDAMILPYDANPRRMVFSERTGFAELPPEPVVPTLELVALAFCGLDFCTFELMAWHGADACG
jgi:hypothetical protein